MPFGNKDAKGKKPEQDKPAAPPKDLPILTPARKPRGQSQGRE